MKADVIILNGRILDGSGAPERRGDIAVASGNGSFPRILARYVRDESLLSLPEAVRRMTSLPADLLGLEGRGRLRVGAHADVVIFNSDGISDRATLDAPRRKALGIHAVLVNGRAVYREGALTGALPGQTLRR